MITQNRPLINCTVNSNVKTAMNLKKTHSKPKSLLSEFRVSLHFLVKAFVFSASLPTKVFAHSEYQLSKTDVQYFELRNLCSQPIKTEFFVLEGGSSVHAKKSCEILENLDGIYAAFHKTLNEVNSENAHKLMSIYDERVKPFEKNIEKLSFEISSYKGSTLEP